VRLLENFSLELIKQYSISVPSPVIAMIPGDNLENSQTPSTFGNTGAIIERGIGVPSIKKEKLKKAGVYIAESFSEVVPIVKKVLEKD